MNARKFTRDNFKPLSDREMLQVYSCIQIISTIHGLGNNSTGSKNCACVPQQLLCVESDFFNIPSPSVLGKITRTYFLPQRNYGFLQCFASVNSSGGGIQYKHCPDLFFCHTDIHISLTSLIKIQQFRQATFQQPQRPETSLQITAKASLSLALLHRNSAISNHSVIHCQTHLRYSHCKHSPNLRINNSHKKKKKTPKWKE